MADQEATEGFRLAHQGDRPGRGASDLDRLTGDSEMSPIIKLVDTMIFTASSAGPSDIHIETRDNEVMVKYRIDGALYEAGEAIDIRHYPDDHLGIKAKVGASSTSPSGASRRTAASRQHLAGRKVDFRA